MDRNVEMLGFLGVFWLAGFTGSGLALVAGWKQPHRWFWTPLCLSAVAVAIGVVGLWTPFSFWPEISYSFSLGGVPRSVDFKWLFIAPLLMGCVSAILALRNRQKRPAQST